MINDDYVRDPFDQKQMIGIDDAEVLARTEHELAITAEKQSVKHYWRLGKALRAIKSTVKDTSWLARLADLGIHPKRAARALRLAEQFDAEEDVTTLGSPHHHKQSDAC